jgi:hypothetical protein
MIINKSATIDYDPHLKNALCMVKAVDPNEPYKTAYSVGDRLGFYGIFELCKPAPTQPPCFALRIKKQPNQLQTHNVGSVDVNRGTGTIRKRRRTFSINPKLHLCARGHAKRHRLGRFNVLGNGNVATRKMDSFSIPKLLRSTQLRKNPLKRSLRTVSLSRLELHVCLNSQPFPSNRQMASRATD